MNGLTENDLRAVLIAATRADGTAKATADKLGISPQYLSDVIRGHRGITAPLAERLGYRQVVLYVPKEKE